MLGSEPFVKEARICKKRTKRCKISLVNTDELHLLRLKNIRYVPLVLELKSFTT